MLNILILRVSAIGDVIHTLPCIFLLKALIPGVRISWVVQKKAASLLVNQPFLEHVYVLPDNFLHPKNIMASLQIATTLRKIQWDGIIDFQGLGKTSILLALLRGKKYGFDKNNARWGLSTWFTHKQVSPEFNNIIQKNLALAAFAAYHLQPFKSCPSINNLQPAFSLTIQPHEQHMVDGWILENHITPFIALCPNTTWKSKHWPQKSWSALVRLLKSSHLQNIPLIIVGSSFGPAAQELLEDLHRAHIQVHSLPGWNLATTGYALQKAQLVIAPDTGLLHLCDYLGISTIGIFGPTHKKKHGPFLDADNIRQAIQISCPHVYKKEHGENEEDCMEAFTANDMAAHIFAIMPPRNLV